MRALYEVHNIYIYIMHVMIDILIIHVTGVYGTGCDDKEDIPWGGRHCRNEIYVRK